MIDLDLFTLIVAIASIGAFAVPLAYHFSRVKHARAKQQLQFEQAAKEKNIHLDIQESWRGRYFIGLDSNQQLLIYSQLAHNPLEIIVDLKQIGRITLDEKSHPIGTLKEKRVSIDYLALQLQPNDSHLPHYSLELYDGDLFSDLIGEKVIALKWLALLNKCLHSEMVHTH